LVGPDYLESLRKRLIFLRELLADDGSIYVHVDCRVGHYVKILMDEVFGEEHFINDIARIKCNPKNFLRRAYGNIKDVVLFYSKKHDYVWNDPRQPFTDDDILRLFPKVGEDSRRYATNPLHAPGETENGSTGRTWRSMLPPRGRHWRYPPEELDKLDRLGLIEWSNKGIPRKKIYADDYVKKGKKMQDVWNFKDPQFPSYPTEKNLEMLKMIVGSSSDAGDLVLDAYCGSGTTLVAAEELGRRWVGIDDSTSSISTAAKRMLGLGNCRPFKILHASSP
jgi:adenine-specific DNA-methyltransferase